ncbi:MAG: chromosomal replication initiator protein DnaA [Actinobacteria bacterium]|nr:MAG: chromosomal replication initiator protein DnaA [Actinomycetota bacterium]
MLVTEAQHLWTQCSALLRAQVSDATWRTWFEAVHPVAVEDGTLVLAVPSALAKERIEGRYLGLVRDVMSDATGSELSVRFDVRTEHRSRDDLSQLGIMGTAGWQDPTLATATAEPPKAVQVKETPLDLRYTFDAFVTGASNRFAHAAALSVAETPAKSYNPLFIHGNAGLGKTHLLHAIGNYVRENFPTRHVRYVSTETFMNEFVDAIRTNTTTSFKRRYRECDVLLVDDIQFMENKEGLQEEFFHTFNSLYGASKQIVITSDRPPRSIATLEDRLRSRFLSGLVTDVQPPELETRLAILREKAQGEQASIPAEVLEFIATNVTDNIRELEGALIRVAAFASLNDQPVDLELAQRVLSDIVDTREPRRITPRLILESTATTFGFSVEELCGTSRRRPLVTARQIGMYVFRELTEFSYPAIAREFGGRDHTTVIHAVEKVSALMKERRQIYDQVTELLHLIRSGG